MEQKEFIEVTIPGTFKSIMVSISSIAFVTPTESGARITMKERATDNQAAYYIDTSTSFHSIKTLIQAYHTQVKPI